MRNIFTAAAHYIHYGTSMLRIAYGGASSGLGIGTTIEAFDALSKRAHFLQKNFQTENFDARMLFIGAAMYDADVHYVSPASFKELVTRLDLACDRTREALGEEDTVSQSMARLHGAAKGFTDWYKKQDARAMDIVDSVFGHYAAQNVLMSLGPIELVNSGQVIIVVARGFPGQEP